MLPDSATLVAIVAVALAGFVGGFAGFGGAMIFMPVASALIEPRVAAASFLVTSTVLMMPLVWSAMRICAWRTVLPASIGATLTVPLGAAVLAIGDPVAIRWAISAVVLGLLALMMSGWRYAGQPGPVVATGVGGVSGLLGGLAQIAGPPVIVFWMSGPNTSVTVRANLISFFTIVSASSFAAYAWNGFFTVEAMRQTLMLAPAYGIALFLGARMFRRASERGYRRLAYAIIATAAVSSLPLLDGLLR
ncbi:hypothetical protein EDC22_101222 [Tepidamorphus gemmatus]|uniref:Probable membrane transporter protein n=1 Tax=Tepidamorphus gemmatus TaxID=747076 RepID=A0A4R3MKT3_9HYPH|nr:TSUP family transporter [Tepidamorphus gemmatus]TCT13358.1 hypothetical protein EDC22_101222 [Tepidamorphus gemmatus]